MKQEDFTSLFAMKMGMDPRPTRYNYDKLEIFGPDHDVFYRNKIFTTVLEKNQKVLENALIAFTSQVTGFTPAKVIRYKVRLKDLVCQQFNGINERRWVYKGRTVIVQDASLSIHNIWEENI